MNRSLTSRAGPQRLHTAVPNDGLCEDPVVCLTAPLHVDSVMPVFFVVTATFIRETGLDIVAPDDGPPRPIEAASNAPVVIDDHDAVSIQGRTVDPKRLTAALAGLPARRDA